MRPSWVAVILKDGGRMKTIVRIIATLAMIFACLLTVAIPSFAGERVIYDELGIFTEEQERELISYISDEQADSSTKFTIVTDSGPLMLEEYYRELVGASYNRSEIILVVRKNGGVYNYDMYTYGDAHYDIDEDEINRILDHSDVFDNIKSGKVYDGVKAFVTLSAKASTGTLRAPFYTYLLPCAGIALLIVSVTVVIIISRYKTKLKSPSYPLDRYARLNLTHSNDMLVDTVVTRVKINTSSHSGGRSGGGRSGGGHRGGR